MYIANIVKLLFITFTLIFRVHPLLFVLKYYHIFSFIADFSTKLWVHVSKRKFDVFRAFKQFKTMIEKRTKKTINFLRKQNGEEFTSLEFKEYY